MLKIQFLIISIFSIYLVACSNHSPTAPDWDKSLSGAKEVPINKNLIELKKEMENKNKF